MSQETALRKALCEQDSFYFHRYFFKKRHGMKMLINPHHVLLNHTLNRVLSGEINRLIINMPPGYNKTEQTVISFMAHGLAVNPQSKFIHSSFSHNLALTNSNKTRGIIRSNAYQSMWPSAIKQDTDAKQDWYIEKGGGVHAASTLGEITGFRAGLIQPGVFAGAFIWDDPMKPADAAYPTKRDLINEAYHSTIKSRLAIETVPIIVIGQRLDYDDVSGYLLRGGSGEVWHHLNLPMVIDKSQPYPEQYTHGIPIDHNLDDGWLWPIKHNDKHKAALQSNRRFWNAQAMQDPRKSDLEGALWNETLINTAKAMKQPWKLKRRVIGVDPAVTSNPGSDEWGIVAASAYTDGNYSVDVDFVQKVAAGKKKPTVGESTKIVMEAYKALDADAVVAETNQGGDLIEATLRSVGFTGRIIKVHATRSKHLRAEPIAAIYEQFKVKHADGLGDLEDEMMEFLPGMPRSPNRLDACVYALTELVGKKSLAGTW